MAVLDTRVRVRIFGANLFLSALIFVLDQAAKFIVARHLALNDAIPVIPGFFSISHVLNPGAAFSLFANGASDYTRSGLITFSCIVIVVLLLVLWRSAVSYSRMNVALSLILGGAAGNLVDRLTIGSVVDFLAFHFGSFHWPDFNVADSAIVIGSFLLIADTLLSPQKTVESGSAAE
jgi:signal peptidase II